MKVKRGNFWTFVNMGMLAGIAVAVFSSRYNGDQPAAGSMFSTPSPRASSAVRRRRVVWAA